MDDASIGFVLDLARALHRYGTPSHRLEEALKVICGHLGVTAEIFGTPTTIIISPKVRRPPKYPGAAARIGTTMASHP